MCEVYLVGVLNYDGLKIKNVYYCFLFVSYVEVMVDVFIIKDVMGIITFVFFICM